MIDISKLWVAEWIVCAFFTYLILLVVRRPLPRRPRLRVLAVSIVCIGLSIMLSQLRASPVLQIVREWIPGIYLMQGCWLSGLFFERPMTAVAPPVQACGARLSRRPSLGLSTSIRSWGTSRTTYRSANDTSNGQPLNDDRENHYEIGRRE